MSLISNKKEDLPRQVECLLFCQPPAHFNTNGFKYLPRPQIVPEGMGSGTARSSKSHENTLWLEDIMTLPVPSQSVGGQGRGK